MNMQKRTLYYMTKGLINEVKTDTLHSWAHETNSKWSKVLKIIWLQPLRGVGVKKWEKVSQKSSM